MRTYFFAGAILAIMAASCNNAQPEATGDNAAMPAENEMAAAGTKASTVKLDPVCEMEWDSEWTDYTVYMDDTVRFCSENCKTAFLARPEKYVKAH